MPPKFFYMLENDLKIIDNPYLDLMRFTKYLKILKTKEIKEIKEFASEKSIADSFLKFKKIRKSGKNVLIFDGIGSLLVESKKYMEGRGVNHIKLETNYDINESNILDPFNSIGKDVTLDLGISNLPNCDSNERGNFSQVYL